MNDAASATVHGLLSVRYAEASDVSVSRRNGEVIICAPGVLLSLFPDKVSGAELERIVGAVDLLVKRKTMCEHCGQVMP